MSSPKETKDGSGRGNDNGSGSPSSSPSTSVPTPPPSLTPPSQPKIETIDTLFMAGPGILERVQAAKTTLKGRKISFSVIDHLFTSEEAANLAGTVNAAPRTTYSSEPPAAPQPSPFLGPPFNTLSQVTDHLGIGGFASMSADNLANAFPGRHLALIINATYEVPAFRPKAEVKDGKAEEPVESLRIPVGDDADADLYVFFGEFTAKIQAMIAKNPKAVAIVHCMAGVSRSATLAIAYLMKTEKLSLEAAFTRLRSIRPVIRPNLNFLRQLAQLEEELVEPRGEWVTIIGSVDGCAYLVPRFIADCPHLREVYRF